MAPTHERNTYVTVDVYYQAICKLTETFSPYVY